MTLPVPPDALERARTGDAAAFEELLLMHERQVLGVAVRLTGNIHDGQDVAQEVFLRLHRELRRFTRVEQLAPWLYRVTVNVCFDAHRKAKRAHVDAAGLSQGTWRSTLPTAEHRLAQEQELSTAMRTLTERECAALTLRELEGLTTAEVAEILGSTESTVRVQIAAARVKLRKCLQELRGKKQ